MKRSSSKLISKAGSVRNINKNGFKFNFELHIESVDKMMGTNDVVVTWERGAKAVATRPARVDKASRTAHFGGQVLTQEVTLFKKKKEGANFEEKVFKLTVRQGSDRGKVVGKIDIDFAEYVDIPSFSKRIGASLSSGGRIVMRVMSTYIGEAKARRGGSRGSASQGSRDPESDGLSATPDEDERSELDADLGADLDDLEIDDDPPPKPAPVLRALPAPPAQPPARKPSSLRKQTRAPNPAPPVEDSPSSNGNGLVTRMRRKPSAPSPKRENSGLSASVEAPTIPGATPVRAPRQRTDSDVGATNAGAPSKAEFDRLRRDNRQLRRRIEDLELRNAELERKVEESRDFEGSSESLEQLMVENTALRRDVGDLQAKLDREPVYADVVRDLREAKMALAILTLEKDELTQEVRKMRRR